MPRGCLKSIEEAAVMFADDQTRDTLDPKLLGKLVES